MYPDWNFKKLIGEMLLDARIESDTYSHAKYYPVIKDAYWIWDGIKGLKSLNYTQLDSHLHFKMITDQLFKPRDDSKRFIKISPLCPINIPLTVRLHFSTS